MQKLDGKGTSQGDRLEVEVGKPGECRVIEGNSISRKEGEVVS